MIVGFLVMGLLVAREVVRAGDPDARAVRILGRVLVPAAVGFAAILVIRLADLVVGSA